MLKTGLPRPPPGNDAVTLTARTGCEKPCALWPPCTERGRRDKLKPTKRAIQRPPVSIGARELARSARHKPPPPTAALRNRFRHAGAIRSPPAACRSRATRVLAPQRKARSARRHRARNHQNPRHPDAPGGNRLLARPPDNKTRGLSVADHVRRKRCSKNRTMPPAIRAPTRPRWRHRWLCEVARHSG